MNDFLENIKKGLTSDCIEERRSANKALLAYDMGRAKTLEEEKNARKEFNFRMFAFENGYGIREAMRVIRKYRI